MVNNLNLLIPTVLAFTGWFLASYIYHGLGITLGYHRLLTHSSVKIPKWLTYLICSGGYLALMGSPAVWVSVHRLHHQKSDMPGDPHTPNDGFMHALVGWMGNVHAYQSDEEIQNQARDLVNDPVFKFLGLTHSAVQAQKCLAFCVAFRVVLFMIGGPIAVVANVIAAVTVFFSTQFVNTFCHLTNHGYASYESNDNSRNVWWVAILTLGEGWHNNHHAIPKSARHGLEWNEFDFTWLTISFLQKIGLAKDVVLPNELVLSKKRIGTKNGSELINSKTLEVAAK